MMKTNIFLTMVKSWMETYFTKLGEEYDIVYFGAISMIVFRRKSGHSTSVDPLNDRPSCTKIFYASRTHSQLSQVVPELRKLRREAYRVLDSSTASRPSMQVPMKNEARKRKYETMGSEADCCNGHSETRFVSLGSRRQLCLNEELKAKGGDLDERCRELLQGISLKYLSLSRGDEG